MLLNCRIMYKFDPWPDKRYKTWEYVIYSSKFRHMSHFLLVRKWLFQIPSFLSDISENLFFIIFFSFQHQVHYLKAVHRPNYVSPKVRQNHRMNTQAVISCRVSNNCQELNNEFHFVNKFCNLEIWSHYLLFLKSITVICFSNLGFCILFQIYKYSGSYPYMLWYQSIQIQPKLLPGACHMSILCLDPPIKIGESIE